jgi:polyisoprenoid-binding protein YceI
MGRVRLEVAAGRAPVTRFVRRRLLLICVATLAILSPALPALAQESAVQLDPAQTKIAFSLDSSLHTVHGDFRLKSSTIRFDPSTSAISGAIVVDATSGESGNDGRDRKMHREILESDKFPEIRFTPKQVTGTLAASGTSKMEVAGQVRLHGQDHEVSLPIEIQLQGQQIQLTTHLSIPYVQWGLKSPNTFILRASNTVLIEIHAAGTVAK